MTLDNVLLSGHRRHAACKMAGLTHAPCRRANVRSTDPEFLTLLVEHNRQRVKSADERLREEVITADPEESYRRLVDHRRRRCRVDVDTIEIVGEKRRSTISKAKGPFLAAVLPRAGRAERLLAAERPSDSLRPLERPAADPRQQAGLQVYERRRGATRHPLTC